MNVIVKNVTYLGGMYAFLKIMTCRWNTPKSKPCFPAGGTAF